MGTFLVTGIGLSTLINSEEGPWHEICTHQPAFSQEIPEHSLGVGGSNGPFPTGSAHAVTQLLCEKKVATIDVGFSVGHLTSVPRKIFDPFNICIQI